MSRWPKISLSEFLEKSKESATLLPSENYHELTVRLWGKGVISRGKVIGAEVGTPRNLARMHQLVMSKIDARHGAVGLVPPELDGAIVSNDFPVYSIDKTKALPAFVGWFTKTPEFVELCKASSEGTTNRVRLQEGRFLEQRVGLPPLDEQHRIVAKLDSITEKSGAVSKHLDTIKAQAEHLLAIRFQETLNHADWRPMAESAPLIRREAEIDLEGSYPELGIRSFGKGTFHKPALSGGDVGTKRLYRIEPGDLLFSNVFAWEGAIAIAQPCDQGRYGSHRFISCVANQAICTATYLRYYFLSQEGMEKIGEASPGGAGRNRTLGLEKLMALEVPIPPLHKQQAFDALQSNVAALKAKHAATREALAALHPSILERIFGQVV